MAAPSPPLQAFSNPVTELGQTGGKTAGAPVILLSPIRKIF